MDATTFAALGEPSRLRIVELLREGPVAVGEIAERLDLRQPQVSKHLRVLKDASLVEVEARHRLRLYHLRPDPFARIADWLDTFERQWEARLDSLGDLLEAQQDPGTEEGA